MVPWSGLLTNEIAVLPSAYTLRLAMVVIPSLSTTMWSHTEPSLSPLKLGISVVVCHSFAISAALHIGSMMTVKASEKPMLAVRVWGCGLQTTLSPPS